MVAIPQIAASHTHAHSGYATICSAEQRWKSRVAEQCKILEEHRAALEKQIADLQNAQILPTHGIEQLISLDEREADIASEPLPRWAA
ncbi:MAG: hypothetical protein WBS19_11675 [Candidatus Korobacteraceae bacterium]